MREISVDEFFKDCDRYDTLRISSMYKPTKYDHDDSVPFNDETILALTIRPVYGVKKC